MNFSRRQMVKSRTIKWVKCVTRRPIGEKKNAYRLLVGKSEGMRTVRGLRLMWEDIAKMLKKYDSMRQTGLMWLRMKLSEGLYKYYFS